LLLLYFIYYKVFNIGSLKDNFNMRVILL